MAAEAERAAAAHERRVGAAQPVGDRPRGPRDERRVQRRLLAQHLGHPLDADHQRLGVLHRARGGAVVRVVEQQPLADRVAGAERDEPHRTPAHALLDRDAARRDDREDPPRVASWKRISSGAYVAGCTSAASW
jgi:hypothetical protein